MRVYIGTYTHGGGQGISTGELDPATGRLTVDETAAAVLPHPSFLASAPGRLYVVSEVDGGSVHAFAADPNTGRLTPLNSAPSGGAHPCHLSVDPRGRFVLVANYTGGTVALLPLDADSRFTGAADVKFHEGTGPHPERQERPHAHAIVSDPAGRYALAADLGIDRILCYEIDPAQGRLLPRGTAGATRPGAGPRHLVFAPDGRRLYTINELDSTVTAWDYDAQRGRLQEIHTLALLPEDFTDPNTAAAIHIHPSGRFLYASNRGHDSLAVFAVAPDTGRLTPRGPVPAGGRTPRGFALEPTGTFLLCAHQDSGTITTFSIDQDTGDLTPTGHVVQVPSPVCIEVID